MWTLAPARASLTHSHEANLIGDGREAREDTAAEGALTRLLGTLADVSQDSKGVGNAHTHLKEII
jgi:hypothetical protein